MPLDPEPNPDGNVAVRRLGHPGVAAAHRRRSGRKDRHRGLLLNRQTRPLRRATGTRPRGRRRRRHRCRHQATGRRAFPRDDRTGFPTRHRRTPQGSQAGRTTCADTGMNCAHPSCSEPDRYYHVRWRCPAHSTTAEHGRTDPVPDSALTVAALKACALPETDQTRYGRATIEPPAHHVDGTPKRTPHPQPHVPWSHAGMEYIRPNPRDCRPCCVPRRPATWKRSEGTNHGPAQQRDSRSDRYSAP